MIILDCENKEELLESIAECAYNTLGLKGDCTVEVDYVSESDIRQINATTRNVDKATDVLSFPALFEIMPFTQKNYPFEYDTQTNSVSLGSIVICLDVAKRQAIEYGHSEQRERAYLFLHGLLHLLGYDHIEEEDKRKMRIAEENILQKLSITRDN